MKLYATITSERASKGQGGNEFLLVDFTIGKKEIHIGQIELYLFDDDERHGCDENEWLLKWRFCKSDDWEILKQGHIKGGNQKIEKYYEK